MKSWITRWVVLIAVREINTVSTHMHSLISSACALFMLGKFLGGGMSFPPSSSVVVSLVSMPNSNSTLNSNNYVFSWGILLNRVGLKWRPFCPELKCSARCFTLSFCHPILTPRLLRLLPSLYLRRRKSFFCPSLYHLLYDLTLAQPK